MKTGYRLKVRKIKSKGLYEENDKLKYENADLREKIKAMGAENIAITNRLNACRNMLYEGENLFKPLAPLMPWAKDWIDRLSIATVGRDEVLEAATTKGLFDPDRSKRRIAVGELPGEPFHYREPARPKAKSKTAGKGKAKA